MQTLDFKLRENASNKQWYSHSPVSKYIWHSAFIFAHSHLQNHTVGLVHIHHQNSPVNETHTQAGMKHSWGVACALWPLISGGVGEGSGYKSSSVCYSGLSPPPFKPPKVRGHSFLIRLSLRGSYFYYHFLLLLSVRYVWVVSITITFLFACW